MTNHYETLRIQPDATTEEIQEAYHRLSEIWDPDECDDKDVARRVTGKISKAKEVLLDPKRRSLHDERLRYFENSAAGPSGSSDLPAVPPTKQVNKVEGLVALSSPDGMDVDELLRDLELPENARVGKEEGKDDAVSWEDKWKASESAMHMFSSLSEKLDDLKRGVRFMSSDIFHDARSEPQLDLGDSDDSDGSTYFDASNDGPWFTDSDNERDQPSTSAPHRKSRKAHRRPRVVSVESPVVSRPKSPSEADDAAGVKVCGIAASTRLQGVETKTVYRYLPVGDVIEMYVNGNLKAQVQGDRLEEVFSTTQFTTSVWRTPMSVGSVISGNGNDIKTVRTMRGDTETVQVFKNGKLVCEEESCLLHEGA